MSSEEQQQLPSAGPSAPPPASAPPPPPPPTSAPVVEGEPVPISSEPVATKTDGNETKESPQQQPPQTTAAAARAFPCIEQPLRVTLSSHGFYLWGLRNKGRVIARKRRSEKDEWRLDYSQNDQGIVEIHNHKFGGTLSVVVDEATNTSKLVCIPSEKEKEAAEATAAAAAAASAAATNATNTKDKEEDEEEDVFDDEPVLNETTVTTADDGKWCFVRGHHEDGAEHVVLKSLRTGENLAIDTNGNVVLTHETGDDPNLSNKITWDIDAVTGELCFISNPHPSIDSRLRCDMAGLITLTDAWKGWEVFRLMEATHGYVKISSWMHSQWLLCSTADGTVTTCTHAESLMNPNPKGCSKWAIEKCPQGRNGVIIRSKDFGRLLSLQEGVLKTYSETGENNYNSGDTNTAVNASGTAASIDPNNVSAAAAASGNWWSSSVNSMKTMQKRLSSTTAGMMDKNKSAAAAAAALVPQEDTTLWHIEAAHLQTYYFSSVSLGEKPKTIGPFPQVTPNLRKTDKIKLQREPNGTTRLFDMDKKLYLSCSPEGNITEVENGDGEETAWIMDKPPADVDGIGGGNVFRSKPYNLYLSYEDISGGEGDEAATADASAAADPKEASNSGHGGGHFNFFNNKPEIVAQVIGTSTIGKREVWRLEPCMPRAVSSEKLATFAIGTSIAIGTTIAMPFALAGAGAILGAVGAEAGMLFNVIAAGLTGAEALASVGAIGATAYIVFRPEENSLTDDQDDKEEEQERAWSKRPFSNWRNW